MIRLLLLPAIALLGPGCDHSFNPKEEFEERYVLQCFVGMQWPGGGSPQVTAVLAKTYDVNGVDASANTTDPGIAGAEVTLTVNQRPFYLLGAQRTNPEAGRYRTQQWVYTNSISTLKFDAAVSITAKLPNGKILTAHTTVPGQRNFVSNYEFGTGLTSPINREPGKPNWIISWENNDDIEVHLYVPRLTISYTKMVGENEIAGSVPVPLRYVSSPGGTIPYFPSMSPQKQCAFEFAALDSAMANIASGEPDKSKFGVHSARFEFIEYDMPLSKYFASINGSLDQYSIRTDESVYSNINGGIGVLGSYVVRWVDFMFDERYVQRFGYRYR
jgi:hypothetical protein